jgi:CheY-like chemotaxis protein
MYSHARSRIAKILLVEDSEMSRDMLARRLAKRGYEVVIAVDGGPGVTLAQTEAPDLILMDMNLPVLDGSEATRQRRSSLSGCWGKIEVLLKREATP